ncbi:AMIN domain-containing protein, partial [Rhodobacterales bacterium HKCCSP123]|nr:AMIN domain-containing protein [Rhodobacterales bacterium HKCCSP123]
MFTSCLAGLLVCLFTLTAAAQGFGAFARLLPEESWIETVDDGVSVTLGLSQPVPFRVFTLEDPARVVVDFREVAFGAWPEATDLPRGLAAIAAGPAREAGWTRLVLTLETPLAPRTAAMTTDAATGRAHVVLTLAAGETPAKPYSAACATRR